MNVQPYSAISHRFDRSLLMPALRGTSVVIGQDPPTGRR